MEEDQTTRRGTMQGSRRRPRPSGLEPVEESKMLFVEDQPKPSATPPSAPQITSIEPGDTQAYINVSVADDGGSPITGYTAACFASDFLVIFGKVIQCFRP